MTSRSSGKRPLEEALKQRTCHNEDDNYIDGVAAKEKTDIYESELSRTPIAKKSRSIESASDVTAAIDENDDPKRSEKVIPHGDKENASSSNDSRAMDEAFEDKRKDAQEITPTRAESAFGRKQKTTQQHSEAGIIKQIYVENFMCHRKLRVDLNRNVNFICGQNGSGKSAILAAIQICLGASARRTHRARNLKDLVRKDATINPPTSAKVRVTLLNKESDGFQYDTYGETITVERCISLNGGYNGYKLLDQNLKEQSRSKKDLDEMLDTLNIQVENPVAVLDQEEAKKFLTGKSEDKYNFFMKATELERVDKTYATSLDHVEDMIELNDRTKEGLQKKMEHVELLKKRYEEHLEIDRLEEKLHEMTLNFAWSIYHDNNDKYNQFVETLNEVQEKAKVKERDLLLAEEQLSNPETTEDANKQKLDTLMIEANEQRDLKVDLQNQLQAIQGPRRVKERELDSLQIKIEKADKKVTSARRSLQKARDEIIQRVGAAESEGARLAALLKQKEDELASAQQKAPELTQTVSMSYSSYEAIEPKLSDAKNRTRTLASQLRGIRNTISDLDKSSGESLAIWGKNVTKVVQLVEDAKRSGKFQGPVQGPIGRYLKVALGMEEYASIAELAIGSGCLDRFIVTNNRDRSVLQEIRKQVGCSSDCGTYQIADSNRYNVPAPPAFEGIETIASILKIESDLVFNCLVDFKRIDQIVIAKSKTHSEACLLQQDGPMYRITDSNITTVFCLPDGDQWSVKKGSLSMFSNEKRLKQTIGIDKSAALINYKNELGLLMQDLSLREQDEAKLEAEHTRHVRDWNTAKKAMQRNEATIAELQSTIDNMKSEIETSASLTMDTSEYEFDVTEAEEELAGLRRNSEQLNRVLTESLPEVTDLKSRYDDCTIRNQQVLESIDMLEKEMTQLQEAQAHQRDKVVKKRQKLMKYKEVINKSSDRVDEVGKERLKTLLNARKLSFQWNLRTQLSQAENITSEQELTQDPTFEELDAIEIPEKQKEPQYYEVRLEKTKKKLVTERQKRQISKEDAAVAYEKYTRARCDLAAKTDETEAIDGQIEKLRSDLSERKKRWKQFRSHLSRATNIKFCEMLSLNNYYGELSISHDDKTLDLGVQKNATSSQVVSKDVKALSGGERSFTTMCLLVALGETLETPFRIMDEFDVFLDVHSRKLTIKALIHVAKRMNHRQFIFITPQDLSSIQPDPQLKILKLTPPERHTTVGGLTQQTLGFQDV